MVKILTPGAALSRASASAAAASMTCSQLSSTSKAVLSANHAASARVWSPPEGWIPRAAPKALGTSSGSDKEASPTNQAPSLYDARARSATATATVVLPIPPGPTMVRKRRRTSCVVSAAIISSRPTMRVSGPGKLPALALPAR